MDTRQQKVIINHKDKLKLPPMSIVWVACRKSWRPCRGAAQVSDPELRDAYGDLVEVEVGSQPSPKM